MEYFLDYFEPRRYDLQFRINREKTHLEGVTTITGTAKNSVVKFHCQDVNISEILVDGKKYFAEKAVGDKFITLE